MKIGEIEISDVAFEAFLKQSGKRVVEDSDYTKKAEAAADLAKFRAVTGENRSIEDLGKILKAHEENEKKNKTETQLLQDEVKRLNAEIEKSVKAAKEAQFEVRKTLINKTFDELMARGNIKVIEPILDKFRKPFYEMDESKLSQEDLGKLMNEAVTKAREEQNFELQRLGLGNTMGANPATPTPADFGGVNVTPSKQAQFPSDMTQLLQMGAATPWRAGIGNPVVSNPQNPNRV